MRGPVRFRLVFSTEKREGGIFPVPGPAARTARPEHPRSPAPPGPLGTMPSFLAGCCTQQGAAAPEANCFVHCWTAKGPDWRAAWRRPGGEDPLGCPGVASVLHRARRLGMGGTSRRAKSKTKIPRPFLRRKDNDSNIQTGKKIRGPRPYRPRPSLVYKNEQS